MESSARSLFLCLVVVAYAKEASSIRCPQQMVGLELCQCNSSTGSGIEEVICQNLGHTTHEALRSLALVPHVKKLVYVGNNIRELTANIFGSCSSIRLLELTYVDLSRNGIELIHGQSFHCVPNVRVLKLNDNRWHVDGSHVRIFSSMPHLQELHLRNAFASDDGGPDSTIGLRSVFVGSHMNALRVLDLGENGIEFVDSQTFCQLPNLEELHLSYNKLSKIGLDCLDRLRDLYVRNNSLFWLTEDDIRSVEAKRYLSILDLRGNPFHCTDCSERTLHFVEWLKTGAKFVVDKSLLKCSGGSLADRSIISLGEDDLKGTCPKPRHSRRSRSRTNKIITAVILSIIGLLTVVFLYVNRDSIKKSVSRWSKPIRKSSIMKRIHFGYTNMNRESSSPNVATL